MRKTAALALLLLAPGCRWLTGEPQTLDEARARAVAARDHAAAAAEKGEVKAAHRDVERVRRMTESTVVRETCAPRGTAPPPETDRVCAEIRQVLADAEVH